jgi:hypothetical protein
MLNDPARRALAPANVCIEVPFAPLAVHVDAPFADPSAPVAVFAHDMLVFTHAA